MKEVTKRIEAYKAIAQYALENYVADDGSLVTVDLNDITNMDLENSVVIAEKKFRICGLKMMLLFSGMTKQRHWGLCILMI